MSSLKTLRETLDEKIFDKKQLDIKTWKKQLILQLLNLKNLKICGAEEL